MTERFDDEVISAVLDGDADDETTAAVMSDPAARGRLDALRSVQSLMATPPPPAAPERRAESIAAALAEARTSPAVTPLAPSRAARAQRWRPPVEWVAVAAAVVVAVLAIPLIGNLTGGDDEATTAGDAVAVDDAGGDGALASRDGNALLSDADAATEEVAPAATTTAIAATSEAGDSGTDAMAAGDDAAGDAGDSDDAGDAEADFADSVREPTVVNSKAVLDSFLDAGIIGPEYFATDPEIVETVNPTCLEPFADDAGEAFALVLVTPAGGPEKLVVVRFAEDGTTTTFDAEDCTPVG